MPNVRTGNLNPDLFGSNEPDCIIDDTSGTLCTGRIASGLLWSKTSQKRKRRGRERRERNPSNRWGALSLRY